MNVNEVFVLKAMTLLASIVLVLILRRYAGIVSVIALSISFLSSLTILANVTVSKDTYFIEFLQDWLVIPGIKPIGISFTVDALSSLTSTLLCGIALLILIYSIKYMEDGEYDVRRYYFLMLTFITSMLVTVNSSNLILTFIGWEGMSICSYLLVGYYYRDEREFWIGGNEDSGGTDPPSRCASIAFTTTGSADALMLLGIITLTLIVGSPYYEDIADVSKWIYGSNELVVLSSLILSSVGIIAKSAQFPLYYWLPYAMAGPTPVSALLHSATMVKAGVYLLVKLLPVLVVIKGIYGSSIVFFYLITIVGAVSAIVGAFNASIAYELKRVLAYSTVSQVGYMFIALGIAGFIDEWSYAQTASFYHLMSHAIFKASLFLLAGIVIHMGNSRYLGSMKVSISSDPLIFIATLISSLSLIGIPPLIGFWSKDFIAELTVVSKLYPLIAIVTLTSFLTAYYVTRMLILTFFSGMHHGREYIDDLMRYPSITLVLLMLLASVKGSDIKGLIANLVSRVEEELKLLTFNPLITTTLLVATASGIAIGFIKHEETLLKNLALNMVSLKRILKELYSKVSTYVISKSLTYLSETCRRFRYWSLLHHIPAKAMTISKSYVRIINNFVVSVSRLGYGSNLSMYVVTSHITALPRVAVYMERTLNALTSYLGRISFKCLLIMFNVIGYADIDTYLTTYLFTLAVISLGLILVGSGIWP